MKRDCSTYGFIAVGIAVVLALFGGFIKDLLGNGQGMEYSHVSSISPSVLWIAGLFTVLIVGAIILTNISWVTPRQYEKPVVRHVELYWPGHGQLGNPYRKRAGKEPVGWWPTLDIYVEAQHNRHVSDMFRFGKPPGTVLTIIEDNRLYRYEIPLQDPTLGDIDLSGLDVGHYEGGVWKGSKTPDGMVSKWEDRERSEAVDWAKAFGWKNGIPEIGSPEDAFTGDYGS